MLRHDLALSRRKRRRRLPGAAAGHPSGGASPGARARAPAPRPRQPARRGGAGGFGGADPFSPGSSRTSVRPAGAEPCDQGGRRRDRQCLQRGVLRCGSAFRDALRDAVPGGQAGSASWTRSDLFSSGVEIEARPAGRNVRRLRCCRRRALLRRARVPLRRVPEPAVALLPDGRGGGGPRRRQPAPLSRPRGRVPSEAQLPRFPSESTMEAADVIYGVTLNPVGHRRS